MLAHRNAFFPKLANGVAVRSLKLGSKSPRLFLGTLGKRNYNAQFMDYVLTSPDMFVGRFIFSSHHEKSQATLVEHFLQDVPNLVPSSSSDLVGNDVVTLLVLQVIFQIPPTVDFHRVL